MSNKNKVMGLIEKSVVFKDGKLTVKNAGYLEIVIGALPKSSENDFTATLVDVAKYCESIDILNDKQVAYVAETDAVSAKNAMLMLLSPQGNDFREHFPESHNVLVSGNANTLGLDQLPTLYHFIVALDVKSHDSVADAIESFVNVHLPQTGANIVCWNDTAKAFMACLTKHAESAWATKQLKSDNGYTIGYDIHHEDGRVLQLRYNGKRPSTIVRTK